MAHPRRVHHPVSHDLRQQTKMRIEMQKKSNPVVVSASIVGAAISMSATEAMAGAGQCLWMRVVVGTLIVGVVVWVATLVVARKPKE